jgi:cysteine-rich repeat protein
MTIAPKALARASSILAALLVVAVTVPSAAPAQTSTTVPESLEPRSAPLAGRGYPRGDDPVDAFTELFSGGSDLSFSALTFTPDGSPAFYRACRESVASFPVDPGGGALLDVRDDGSQRVELADDRMVSFYGASAASFYVGANGYLTFGRADTRYEATLARHFETPRISALFDDLDARNLVPGVTWKQLGDRVAVTWQNVPEHGQVPGTNNDFQVELFFDGRIRITWLELHTSDSIVGLSVGAGVPAGFAGSDLSATSNCPSCAHGPTTEGASLSPECSPCVAATCAIDPFCCGTAWDEFCVGTAVCRCDELLLCGDAVTDMVCAVPNDNNETCDDGNRVAGDGCDAFCHAEICGDFVVQGMEECDDGNLENGDGCDATCGLDAGTCRVVFGFSDSNIAAAPVGSLKAIGFEVGYAAVDGAFLGEGELAACTPLLATQKMTIEEDELSNLLDLSIDLDTGDVYGPVELLDCLFRPADPSYTPDTGQFSSAIQSIEFGGAVSSANLNVFTVSVVCGAPAVCGDGYAEGAEQCDDANEVPEDGCESDCSATPFDHHTQLFPPTGDLAFSSLTFTPDASPDGYRTCRQSGVTEFPVDPAGGTTVSPEKHEGVEIRFQNDREVLLYGVAASRFFVRGDGSITFGREGENATDGLEGVFQFPRVSVLFDGQELADSPNGELRVQVLDDRVAVTWLNLISLMGDPDSGNDFQVELFFDGRIRMTWLALPAGSGVVGLSRGEGIPEDFEQTDFSKAGDCPSCGHEACTDGSILAPQCSPCAAKVCAADPYCCNDSWDGLCVESVISLCGLACGCGDGVASEGAGEECDDGNRVAGDGCNEDCLDESCGDGDKAHGVLEECEDGNTATGDGCNQTCRIETGYCEMVLSVDGRVRPVDRVEFEIEYDAADGSFVELGGGISCLPENLEWPTSVQSAPDLGVVGLEIGPLAATWYGPRDVWRCFFQPGDPTSPPTIDDFVILDYRGPKVSITRLECLVPGICGDGSLDVTDEACDDGNLTNGDGCDNNCTFTACGNGIATAGEACDDGNLASGDGCDSNCTVTACGNGQVGGSETCDDGDEIFVDGEPCSADCRLIACGKPTDSSGVNPQAKDALFILRVAVGQRTCVLQVCDVDASGKVTAPDALRVLKKAVGQDITLACDG